MNRNELVDAVAGKAELSKTTAKKVVEAVFESITDALKGGGEVRLVGFGIFSVNKGNVARRSRLEDLQYEPTLADLLDDEAMEPVLRSAGFDPDGFRELMRDKLLESHRATLRGGKPKRSLMVVTDTRSEQQINDEAAVAEAFADAAIELQKTAEDTLAEMRQLRTLTSEILSGLEARLSSAGG